MARNSHWRVGAYVLVVTAFLLASVALERKDASRFNRQDRRTVALARRFAARSERQDRLSCNNRRLLLQNQRLVLTVLLHNAQQFSTLPASSAVDGETRQYFLRLRPMLQAALAALAKTPACSG